jgi:hypothetical protein
MIDESVAGQLFPQANMASFSALMFGPGRVVMQMGFSVLETIITSTFALATQPQNAPLIALRVLNERMSDPFNLANMLIKSTVGSAKGV